jgi:hypothetical protein
LHEEAFDHLEVKTDSFQNETLADGTKGGIPFSDEDCQYTISIYPSNVFLMGFHTSTPAFITIAVAAVFVFAILVFFIYDRLVERRQTFILNKAVQCTAIVSSLFPKNVRDRLLQTSNEKESGDHLALQNPRLKALINDKKNEDNSQPIADLFPDCTVMFADIAGFTAWSSTREPAQVFTLLQALYQAFDKIALKRNVFKVETIGDSCK